MKKISVMKRKQTLLMTGALTAFMLFGMAPGFAGFEWKGAPQGATPSLSVAPAPLAPAIPMTSPAAPPVAAVPLAPVYSGTMSDTGIKWNENAPTLAPVVPPPAPVGAAIPLSPVVQKPFMMPPASAPVMSDVVTGFGNDLPLYVAIQQVVPSPYKISWNKDVDSSTHVSWTGDRSWKQVLGDMLDKVGLAYDLFEESVTIKRSDKAPPSMAEDKVSAIPDDMMGAVGTKKMVEADAPPIPMMAQHHDAPEAPMAVQDVQPMSVVPPEMETASAPAKDKDAVVIAMPTSWHAEKGQTLRETLEAWAKLAHTDIYWLSDYDYRLNEPVTYDGNFDAAVGTLLQRFSGVLPQPYGRLHRNPGGRAVLVIDAYVKPY